MWGCKLAVQILMVIILIKNTGLCPSWTRWVQMKYSWRWLPKCLCFQPSCWPSIVFVWVSRRNEIDFLTWLWNPEFGIWWGTNTLAPKGCCWVSSVSLGRLLKVAEFSLSVDTGVFLCLLLSNINKFTFSKLRFTSNCNDVSLGVLYVYVFFPPLQQNFTRKIFKTK